MLRISKKLIPVAAALTIGFAGVACDIDQTQAGEMPDVDVDVDPGSMPEYDVDVADVDVGTTEDTVVITRPTVDVNMPEDTLDVDSEDDGGN